jgi:hypothetical protein
MARPEGALSQHLGLGEAVDHLLDKGAVLAGEATISLGGVELIYLGLNLVLASVETLRNVGDTGLLPPTTGGASPRPSGPLLPGSATGSPLPPSVVASWEGLSAGLPDVQSLTDEAQRQLSEPGERPEQGLARLVLTLVELLRRVLEHQALRRLEGGGLDEAEIERMGVALMELEAKVAELRGVFGLEAADLNIDLGPLGQLL